MQHHSSIQFSLHFRFADTTVFTDMSSYFKTVWWIFEGCVILYRFRYQNDGNNSCLNSTGWWLLNRFTDIIHFCHISRFFSPQWKAFISRNNLWSTNRISNCKTWKTWWIILQFVYNDHLRNIWWICPYACLHFNCFLIAWMVNRFCY